MKVNLLNRWFKYKVPIDRHWDIIKSSLMSEPKYLSLWDWLEDEFDVGQYYNFREEQNYLVFHNEQHYMMFLLKL